MLFALFLLAPGCARKEEAPETSHAVTPAFVDRTWRVTSSSAGPPGSTYEFRRDGTLIVETPGSSPLSGSWTWNEGTLTMVEEGISYPTDILALDDSTFRIRSHNPGEPVELKMGRAP